MNQGLIIQAVKEYGVRLDELEASVKKLEKDMAKYKAILNSPIRRAIHTVDGEGLPDDK